MTSFGACCLVCNRCLDYKDVYICRNSANIHLSCSFHKRQILLEKEKIVNKTSPLVNHMGLKGLGGSVCNL